MVRPATGAPTRLGGSGLGAFVSFMLRLVLAGVLTAVVVGMATLALFFVTAPELPSLLFEPFSLLFMPGMLLAMALSGAHDLEPSVILAGSVLIYFVLFLSAFEWRAWRKRRPGRS